MSLQTHTPKSGDKFIWVRFGALGDVLQALSSAFAVKQKFPEISMSFLTTPPFVDIVKSQPFIDEVICGEKKPFATLLATSKLLREKRYDWIASTFQGSHMAWLAYISGIKNRLGSSKYYSFLETDNIYSWGKKNGMDLYCKVTPSIFASEGASLNAREFLAPLGARKKLFAVVGASSESKMWSLDGWVDFLRPVVADGWGVVINGYGERESCFAKAIMDKMGDAAVVNLVGKLDYLKMVGVCCECDAAVGNDTGPLHMAALCGVPTIGIFDYVQPVEVGYTMPNFACVVGRDENLQTFYSKSRSQSILSEIKASAVLDSFHVLLD